MHMCALHVLRCLCCRTLISQSGELVTAVGKRRLPAHLTLGPVGNLLNSGTPVPAGTYFAAENIEELVLSADK